MTRRTVLIITTCSVLLVVGLSFVGPFLVVNDSARADVVVVLGEDPQRLREGARVFRSVDATRLVLTLNKPTPAATALLRAEGVPDRSIRVVYGVESTADEAGVARSLSERCGWRRVTVVTSAWHTRRAAHLFRRAVGEEVGILTVPAGQSVGWTWWAKSRTAGPVAREIVKLVVDTVRFWSSRPGAFETDVDC